MDKKQVLILSKDYKKGEIVIFVLIAILVTAFNAQFVFNPFFIPLIFLSYNRGINTYLFTLASTMLCSFLISIPYGVEIVVVNTIYFFSCLITCLIKKNDFLKRYGSFIITNVILFLIYFLKNMYFETVINLLLNITLSIILLYGYSKFMKCIMEPGSEFDSRAKVIVMSLFSFLFSPLHSLYFIFMRIIHLIICKTSSSVEGALSIIINCYLTYTLLYASHEDILLLLIPALVSVFLNKKLVLPLYSIVYIFLNIYLIGEFYISNYFYQGILSIVIFLLLNNNLVQNIVNIFNVDESKYIIETNEKLHQTGEAVSNVISYLDVLLTASVDTYIDPSDKVIDKIKKEVCFDCVNKSNCILYNVIKNSLINDFDKEKRRTIFNECLFPYRIIRRVRLSKVSLDNEYKYLQEIKEQNESYKQEIENIYKPLRKIFLHSELIMRKKTKLIEKLEAFSYFIKELSIGEYEISFQIKLKEKNEINNVISLICKTLKKTYYLQDIFFILSLDMYQVNLSSEKLFEVECFTKSKGVGQVINGDSFLYFEEDNKFYVLFSDGMGHNTSSSKVSFFLINALNSYRKIEEDYHKQIDNINTLMKIKINDETYATLDYIIIDLISLNVNLFKCGSFNSYLFQDGVLKRIKSNAPPLGIIANIKFTPLEFELKENSIIVVMSDGYSQDPYSIIENILINSNNLKINEIATLLHNQLSLSSDVDDDKTLLILKVKKIKNFIKDNTW